LSCIDSRAPAEVVLDLGLGDIFNSRIAGNVADVAVLGGMEFACKLAGAKVVLVLGHTACGAVAGAIANAQLGNLTALLAKIVPAVGATVFAGERSASNAAFVDAVARTSVALTIATIRKDSPVLAEMERQGTIKIVGAMYDLGSGAVEFLA
jgi:carbonic anhydrase